MVFPETRIPDSSRPFSLLPCYLQWSAFLTPYFSVRRTVFVALHAGILRM